MSSRFRDAVLDRLAFLQTDHGFRLVGERDDLLRLESPRLGAEVSFDPRGEVALEVFRLGHEDPTERWAYTGMIGRASLERVLDRAVEHLHTEPAVLSGDVDFFKRLAEAKRREAEAWTAYYSRMGPRPQTGRLS